MESISINGVEGSIMVWSYASISDFMHDPKAMNILVSRSINAKEYANYRFLWTLYLFASFPQESDNMGQ